MNKTVVLIGAGIMLMVLLVLGVVGVAMGIGYNNRAIALETQFSAEVKANEVIYDKVWKVIAQKAQISDQYATKFKEIYTQIMDSRYGNSDKVMMNWITESNPQFSPEMYKELSNSISGLREEFAFAQKKQISIKQEHDNLRLKFPSSIIVGSRAELVLKLVTSERTDKAFSSGKDDEVNLFPAATPSAEAKK